MIWILTIILTIIIIWSIISLFSILCNEIELTDIDINKNGLLITISQFYWLGIGALFALGLVMLISYIISAGVICGVKNNDYPGCGVVETTNE